MKLLVIMRMWPGTGKTTLANKLKDEVQENGHSVAIYSTDDYWMEDGEYKFDITKLNASHAWNLERVKAAIQVYDCVIVDNTNIVWKDFKKYVQLAIENQYDIMLAEPNTEWKRNVNECDQKNTHNVPKATIDRMLHKYQNNQEIIEYAEEVMSKMNLEVDIFEYDPMKLFRI